MFLKGFFLFFIGFHLGFSQETSIISSIITSTKIDYDQKIAKIDSILKVSILEKTSVKNVISSYVDWLNQTKKHQKTVEISLLGLSIEEKNNQIDSVHIQKLYYYLGLSKYNLRAYDESLLYFQNALEYQNQNELAGEIYFNLGKCYHKKTDYHNAINYYKLGQSLLLKHNKLDNLFKSYVNITLPYNGLKSAFGYKKARAYFLKADSLIPFTSIGKKYKHYVKIGLGDSYAYNETLDITKASLYYEEAIKICKQKKDSTNLGIIYSNYGNLYTTTNPDLAIKKERKGLSFFKKNDSLKHSINHNIIAYSYSEKELYDKSITHYLKSISYLIGNDWKKFNQNQQKTKVINKNHLLICFNELANVYFKKYLMVKKPEILHQSIETFLLADNLLDLLLIESQEFKSKLFWREQSTDLYGKAIEACFAGDDVEKAFYFMEKNKALLLTKDLKNQQLKQSLNLPNSIVNKEIELKKRIYNLKLTKPSPINNDSIDIALLSTQRNLKKIQDSIELKFTDYKTIDLKTDIINLSELQNGLEDNEVVLSYNVNQYDDYSLITNKNKYTPVIPNCKYGVKTFYPVFGILITKNHTEFFKLNKTEHLKNKVQGLIKMMRSPFKTLEDNKLYNEKAFELYNSLLPSKELQERIKNKKLLIIPDNYLHYLPFEALITTDSSAGTYLIEKSEISYAYSNSFLKRISSRGNPKGTSFVGFAPVNYDSLTLNSLDNSLNEINQVAGYFSGTIYTYKKATKAQFLRVLPKHNVIHLATHAYAQDSISPWVAFTNKKLIQEELSLTTNYAKMVVLSGCNTLLGKQEIGEGVMSLARGFFQSGAQSVVSSLWNIDDRSSAEIMNAFYTNLKAGKSKSNALQSAKLNYLKNHTLSEVSPFYWASFVLLGNTSPIQKSPNNYYWILLLTFILISATIFYCFKKK